MEPYLLILTLTVANPNLPNDVVLVRQSQEECLRHLEGFRKTAPEYKAKCVAKRHWSFVIAR